MHFLGPKIGHAEVSRSHILGHPGALFLGALALLANLAGPDGRAKTNPGELLNVIAKFREAGNTLAVDIAPGLVLRAQLDGARHGAVSRVPGSRWQSAPYQLHYAPLESVSVAGNIGGVVVPEALGEDVYLVGERPSVSSFLGASYYRSPILVRLNCWQLGAARQGLLLEEFHTAPQLNL